MDQLENKYNTMEKIQMPCTEEQFNRDLKPFLVDAGVDLSQCYAFEINDFLQTNYNPIDIVGNCTRSINYKTIDYNPKQFLKHLGIDIYEVGDVVEIGKYDLKVLSNGTLFWLLSKTGFNTKIYKQFGLNKADLKHSVLDLQDVIIYHTTLYDLNKTIQFLKSHEMQEKPFTLEQAKEMLLNEKLKELAFRYYPELKNPVNPIDEDLLEKLSINMFGNANKILIAKQSAISINRVDLDGKSLIVDERIEIILHKVFTGGTLIEFKYK
jgi:hypothetical protein